MAEDMEQWNRKIFSKDIGYKCDKTNSRIINEITGIEYYNIDGIWVNKNVYPKEEENVYHDTKVSDRANVPFTTTNQETTIINNRIHEIVKKINPQNSYILELGCGDGRFTKYLLSLGFSNVIAVDLDFKNTLRLRNRLNPSEREKVLLICDDVFNLYLPEEKFDCIIAIFLFHVIYDKALEAFRLAYKLLKIGGYLINVEPMFEGALIYSLVCHDTEEFIRIAKTHTKVAGPNIFRRPVFDNGENEELLKKSGFEQCRKYPISVYPSLIFGGVLQKIKVSDEKKEEISKILFELAERKNVIPRANCYISKK